jgi:hypothetical protein
MNRPCDELRSGLGRVTESDASKATVLKASHAVHISHPRAVAQAIETAARAFK